MSDLQKSDWLDDWYFVDGSWATPEGTSLEWREVISALRERRSASPGRRIAVTVYDDGRAKFYSPRNCTGPDDVVRLAPDEVAAWIIAAESTLPNAEVRDAADQKL